MLFTNLSPLFAISLCALAEASNPKRGMISDLAPASDYNRDAAALTSPKVSKVSWYYSFGHYPDKKFSSCYQFTMMQFGIDTTSDNGNNFKNLNTLEADVARYRPKHLMTFLEPAIHGVKVDDAISAWRKYIIPIRKRFPKMKVGSPSVINGPGSKQWIQSFNQKCPECKYDFLDVHYYWRTNEFQGEIEMWHKLFPKKPMWVSDIGFQSSSASGPECKKPDADCVAREKKMITWMDNQDYIKRYTYRGEFEHTHGEPHQFWWSFLDDQGNYTPFGKWYLGVQ